MAFTIIYRLIVGFAYEIRDSKLFEIEKTPGFSPHDLNSRYKVLEDI